LVTAATKDSESGEAAGGSEGKNVNAKERQRSKGLFLSNFSC
jgi:hypothetical protein